MKWKTFRIVLFILLVVLNIALFLFYLTQRDARYTSSNQEIEDALALYQKQGITVEAMIRRSAYPVRMLQRTREEVLSRELADRLLGTEYQVAYMNAKKSLYTTDTMWMNLDLGESEMTCDFSEITWMEWSEEEKNIWIEEMVAKCVNAGETWSRCGEELLENSESYTYVEKQGEQMLFFNTIRIDLFPQDRARITFRKYANSGEGLRFSGSRHTILPIDEMLFRALQIRTDEILFPEPAQGDVLREICRGYDRVDGRMVYCLEFVFQKVRIRLNAETQEWIG